MRASIRPHTPWSKESTRRQKPTRTKAASRRIPEYTSEFFIKMAPRHTDRLFSDDNRDVASGSHKRGMRADIFAHAPPHAIARGRALVHDSSRNHRHARAAQSGFSRDDREEASVLPPAAPKQRRKIAPARQSSDPPESPAHPDTESRLRILALRRAMTRRPPGLRMRIRNPCARARFFLDG